MKKTLCAILVLGLPALGFAQTGQTGSDSAVVRSNATSSKGTDSVVVSDVRDSIQTVTVNTPGDTTRIRIGRKNIVIVDKDGKTTINTEKQDENNQKYGDFDQSDDIGDRINQKIEDKFDRKFNRHRNKFEPHWAGFGLGFNSYVNKKGSTSLTGSDEFMSLIPEKSIDVMLNPFELALPVTHNFAFVTGLGLTFNNYRFSGNNNIQYDANGNTVSAPAPDSISYKKSKLKVTYLTLPLLMEFQFPIDGHTAYLSVGGQAGFKLGTKTKVLYGDTKIRHYKDYNTSGIIYGLTARAGYRFLNLYANYNLSTLFEKDKGPELYPFSVGLVFINF